MPDERDSSVGRLLAALVDPHRPQPDPLIPAVKARARVRKALRGGARTAVAFLLALALSVPMLFAAYAVGRDAGGQDRAQRSSAPAATDSLGSELAERWGGTFVWAEEEGLLLQGASDEGSFSIPLPFPITEGSLSPAGKSVGVATWEGGELTVVQGNGNVTAIPQGTDATSPAWDPAGRTLAFESCIEWPTCSLLLYESDGSARTLAPSSGRGVSWSPDGTQLAYVDRSGALRTVSTSTGESQAVAAPSQIAASAGLASGRNPATTHVFDPSWSPDGSYIAAVLDLDANYAVVVLRPDGTVVAQGGVTRLARPDLLWAPESNELFFSEGPVESPPEVFSSSIWLMRPPGWTPTLVLSLPGETRRSLLASPNGEAILLETIDAEAFAKAQATGPLPIWWSVLDRTTMQLALREIADGDAIDWR